MTGVQTCALPIYEQEDDDILERSGQGTGVGLYFMKLLCEDLNIKYYVEDRQDNQLGTKFTFTFEK